MTLTFVENERQKGERDNHTHILTQIDFAFSLDNLKYEE